MVSAKWPKTVLDQSGFSFLESLSVLALVSIVSLIAVSNVNKMDDPLTSATAEMQSFIKRVRARAISTTSAYIIIPSNTGSIITKYSDSCSSSTLTDDPQLQMDLPRSTALSDITWSVCFNSRGLSDSNISILLGDTDGRTRTLEIFLGGAVREV